MDIKDRTIVEQALEIQRLKDLISQLRQEIAIEAERLRKKESIIETEKIINSLNKGNSVA